MTSEVSMKPHNISFIKKLQSTHEQHIKNKTITSEKEIQIFLQNCRNAMEYAVKMGIEKTANIWCNFDKNECMSILKDEFPGIVVHTIGDFEYDADDRVVIDMNSVYKMKV